MKMFKMTAGGGQALLRNKQSAIKKALLYILTPIFCVGLCLGAVFSFSLNNNKVTANAATVKASAAYLDLDGSGKILNGFEGVQKENIYLGNFNDSTLKWLVLAKNDTRYGSGNNLLLFAEDVIGKGVWNDFGDSTTQKVDGAKYVYYGTSKMRANLNGGYYINASGDALSEQITEEESYKSKLFFGLNPDVIKTSNDIITHGVVNLNGGAVPSYITNGTQFTTRYNSSVVAAQSVNTKTGVSDGNNNFSMTLSNSTGMTEITKGDKMFLLDYDDLNNKNYGFANSSGKTYTEIANPGISPNYISKGYSYGYPSYQESNKYFDLQISGFNAISNTTFRIRHPLRNLAGLNNNAATMVVQHASEGSKTSAVYQDSCVTNYGIRPAFVLDTSKIKYATTVTITNSFQSLSALPTQFNYKMFVENEKYDNISSRAKGNIREDNGTLHITYNNPTGLSSGNLLVLLSKNGETDGSVAYQAAIAIDAKATETDSAVTSISLPSGVSLSTHTVSMLYVSDNGGNKSENVYCVYPTDSGIDAPSPQGVTATYDGKSKWIADLTASERPAWLNLDIYNNEKYVKVDSVEYRAKSTDSYAASDITSVKNVGEYKVTMSLADGLKWSGSSETQKSFTITINKKPSTPKPKVDPPQTGIPYVTEGLPNLIADTTGGGTAGTFKWKDGESAKAGTNSYEWIFTPTDTNFTVESGSMELEFQERAIKSIKVKSYTPTDTVYTNTSLTTIKSYFKIDATYNDGNTEDLPSTGFKLKVKAADGKLVKGTNTVIISTSDDKFPIQYDIEVSAIEVQSISLVLMNKTQFTYPVTADEIKAAITSVTVVWNTGSTGPLDDLSILTVTGTLNAGASVTITIGVDGLTIPDYTENISIAKGTLSPTVTFTNDTVMYDGSAHKIEATVTGLPTGLTLTPAYTVTGDATTYDADGYTNAGTYNYSVAFTHTDPNYEQYTTASAATLTIGQATVTGIVFNNVVKPEITGTTYTVADLDMTGVPSWVTVEYLYNGAEFTGVSEAGTYTITAKFTHDDPNYEKIADKTATLTISDKPPVEGADDIVVEPAISAVYSGSAIDYSAKNVPEGVTVTYEILKDGVAFEGTEITEAGVYAVTVKFEVGADKMPIADKICVVTIEKADYDMSGIAFEDKTVTYDGENHTLTITGEIPDGVSVEYYYNGAAFIGAADIGEYEIIAKFTHANANYNDILDMTATLTISDAVVTGISAKIEDGAKFTTANTLDDLKAKLSAEIEYNNGTKEAVSVDNLTVTCDTLRDGGKFDVGTQTITIKYTDENGTEHTTTVTVTVAKAKVALPVYKGTLSYTGLEIKPTANDFDGYDSAIMSFVETKTIAGLNAGAYKAVFALKDSDRYEWATTTSLKKSVFAAAVFDGEISIDPTFEAAVDWNIAKAKISATKAEGKLPVFASESYTGSLGEVIALKYYTDETFATEVAADELAYSTKYFVRAELLDKANFELDETATVFAAKPFEYLTPAKELTVWEKIVVFLKANWLWLVIALVALILLITIIALAAKHAKKKRLLAEKKEAEEKEERKREKEEREERRREEREERMARMSQQQAMPQMMMPQMLPSMMPQMQMPQPQPQPQYAPQSQTVQPVIGGNGGGTVSETQFMQMQAELAALKAEQSAKEMAMRAEMTAREAAMKAEQVAMKAEQNAVLRSDVNALRSGEQVGGISVDAMTEIMTAALKNVLATATQQAIAAQPAQPAQLTDGAANATPVATQVPPDAVMTTVTTTKIDTTKKTQNGQGNAQAARPTRSFVPPMPVDDGRVFDVGGFYKPADPVDLVDDDVDNK